VENGQQLVACGGFDTLSSCLSWRRGEDDWTDYATLSQERYGHAAISINNNIIVLGGPASRMSGEIVKDGTELTLQNSGLGLCAIPYQNGFVTIGGYPGNSGSHGKVDRYDSVGKYLDSLPDLATPRRFHSCTTFDSNGEQVLLVAGGINSGWLASTETFSNGRWTPGGNLPRAMYYLRAAHLNQQVVVTGGQDGRNSRDEVLQYNVEAGTWTQIGTLHRSRSSHAIAEVNLDAVCRPVVDCEVGDWKKWGECSVTCGGNGTRTKAREVVKEPQNGGAACPELEETEVCITDKCEGTTTESEETLKPTQAPETGLGETGTIAIAVSGWILLLALLICLALFCCRRWILSRTFKDDVNNDYGIYPENGDNVVMEAVDRNTEYEQPGAGGEDQAIGRQVSENEYDKMYTDEHEYHQNEYDKMY